MLQRTIDSIFRKINYKDYHPEIPLIPQHLLSHIPLFHHSPTTSLYTFFNLQLQTGNKKKTEDPTKRKAGEFTLVHAYSSRRARYCLADRKLMGPCHVRKERQLFSPGRHFFHTCAPWHTGGYKHSRALFRNSSANVSPVALHCGAAASRAGARGQRTRVPLGAKHGANVTTESHYRPRLISWTSARVTFPSYNEKRAEAAARAVCALYGAHVCVYLCVCQAPIG